LRVEKGWEKQITVFVKMLALFWGELHGVSPSIGQKHPTIAD
jgi:hypothetical protein